MTDQQVQRKLNQLVKICNELVDEAHRRYGRGGQLFYEAEGSFHFMDGDSETGLIERQDHVRLTSNGVCTLGAGAW